MTKEEVLEFIYSKQIPLSFVWEDGYEWFLYLYTPTSSTTTDYYFSNNGPNLFPLFDNFRHGHYNINYSTYKIMTKAIFYVEKETMEECLSEFLYWFELNKHKCKEITYYETNS